MVDLKIDIANNRERAFLNKQPRNVVVADASLLWNPEKHNLISTSKEARQRCVVRW
jgi:hypothetical protein